MSVIQILPETLVNQIAAGEVVERPASVVKELVENSLDAQATKISIDIKDAGKVFIKITDNGSGMSREDCKLAFQRHATSKISKEADLWNISTMGFRGEAVASISSVSKIILKSKEENDVVGTEITAEGGDILSIADVGMSRGTQIEVHDLFYNTPARQKYLKKDSTELGYITSMLNSIALSHPEVSFKLIHNGKIISDLSKVTDLSSRIGDIFGKATAEAMLPVFYGGSAFQINGFIGKPAISRASTKHQYFFVNGRSIQHYALAGAIKSAYHSMLMENKKPVFVLNIKIDPSLIDVNVHPRKTEVRFEDQQSLIRTVYTMVKTTLNKSILIPKGYTESRSYMSDSFPKFEAGNRNTEKPTISFREPQPYNGVSGNSHPPIFGENRKRESVQDALDFTENFSENREAVPLEKNRSVTPIAQVSNSYIVAKNNEGLVLIDQHAGHERVRYEQLMDQFESQKKSTQPLLTPVEIEFTNDEVVLVEENMQTFHDLGFEIEPFGGKTFIVRAVPVFLVKEDASQVIRGVLDDIANGETPSKVQGRTDIIINYMACRSAIKFGQALTLSEMEALVDQMDGCVRPYTCPHGRPTMVALSFSELEKMFGRK